MKNIGIKILIIWICFVIFGSNVQATEENKIAENTNTVQNVTEEKPTETAKNETMYVQERCNIRASYSADSERVGGLDVGTEVTVVAEYSNGWYKIEYDGKEAYIKSGILRSTKPEIPEETEQTENEAQTENTTVEQTEPVQTSEQVAQAPEENTDEVLVEDAELINEIGVLPEVGKNIADYLTIGVIMIAIAFLVYVKYKF